MIGNQTTLPKSITKDQWLRVLSDNWQQDQALRHPRERRAIKRRRIPALATITFQPADGNGEPTIWQRRPVLDASHEGLALSSYQRIPAGAVLSIEMLVGDKRFLLTGKVTHCSGLPGSVKIGVALEFPPSSGEQEKPTAH